MNTKEWNATEIEALDRVFRLNLINSITGIKPANLIGTQSSDGIDNLAVFSSVIHLGSNPALIGCISRPTGEVPRHTYDNILETKHYTINAVPSNMVKNAHYTSVKFDRDESEFEKCNIKPRHLDQFPAPFVAQSPIQIGLKLEEIIDITLNGTIMIIGSVQFLSVADHILNEKGYLNLEEAKISGISGLNRYYELGLIDEFPYARKNEIPKWNN